MLRSVCRAVILLLPACGGGGGSDAVTGVCYGPSGWQVCLDARATGQVQLQGMLDTGKSDASNPCLNSQPASWSATQLDSCIIVGDTIAVTSLAVTGPRPLVLVAQTEIAIMNLLDVASHRATGAVGGGSLPAGDCDPFGSSPDNGPPGGGGAGGHFNSPGGGDGGTGDGTNRAGGQELDGVLSASTGIRGGCVGQPGGGGRASDGGAGGGAVYLVSAGMISLSGKIDVSGAGGAGSDAQHGGGGGGSGGMIVLHAASITTTPSTLLIANGGGGGGGSSAHDLQQATTRGDDGHEPVLTAPIAPALGGQGGLGAENFNGGDGGNGYPAATNTVPGLKGQAGDTGAGGGGGGGGGGYIGSNQDLGMAVVSPAVDIKP